ncbi:hypothetical protein [Halorientalis halophila]|uniref:hypothetical protein n=1 Tax=Halorientalis halophila TaxID=3108499 RepID=UPI00300884BD
MSKEASEQVTYSAAQLRKRVTEGTVDESHPHAGMAPDAEPRELLNTLATAFDPAAHPGLDSVEDSELYQTILRNEATDALTDAVEAGNVSQMQYAVGMVNHDKEAQDESTRTWLRRQLATEAGVFFVTGGMGAGKSDWALELADEFHMATRGQLATNIESAAEQNRPLSYINSYDALEAFFGETRDDVMMILDETGQGLSGYGSDAQQARALAKTLKLVRKGDAPAGTKRVIVLIGQTVRDASRDLRRLVAQTGRFFHKPSKKRVEVYGDDLIGSELSDAKPERTIVGVPPTRFQFDTTEGPSFDMSGALNADEKENPEDARKDEKKRQAQRLRDNGHTTREIAEVVEMSRTWVSDNTERNEG